MDRSRGRTDHGQNRQLESLYLREVHTRLRVWRQYEEKISEEAIYNINAHNDNAWFDRAAYINDLNKVRPSVKETTLEREVRQLREKLEVIERSS